MLTIPQKGRGHSDSMTPPVPEAPAQPTVGSHPTIPREHGTICALARAHTHCRHGPAESQTSGLLAGYQPPTTTLPTSWSFCPGQTLRGSAETPEQLTQAVLTPICAGRVLEHRHCLLIPSVLSSGPKDTHTAHFYILFPQGSRGEARARGRRPLDLPPAGMHARSSGLPHQRAGFQADHHKCRGGRLQGSQGRGARCGGTHL